MKVLIVSDCKEKLHEKEFVDPLAKILKKMHIPYFVKHYTKIEKKDIEKASKIILSGTSLLDNGPRAAKDFWFLEESKPILGICLGVQMIGLKYGLSFKKKEEMGMQKIKFKKKFLGMLGEKQVYLLHTRYNNFRALSEFEVYSEENGVSYAVKHKEKPIYGVLFHPEVRNKKIIQDFLELS